MIYYNDGFYDDIEDLIDDLTDYREDNVKKEHLESNYPDGITVQECESKKIQQYDKSDLEYVFDQLYDLVPEDMFPEDTDVIDRDIKKAVFGAIDLEKLNKAMPEVWFLTEKRTHYSLEDLLKLL